MKKASIILTIVIILLVLLSAFMTYYMFYWRKGYLDAATTMYEYIKTLEDAGVSVIGDENGETHVIIKKENNVVMEE